MAWVTGEECEHFSQFPNEPDMEALTYWAQRFEPVIRDESRDEIILVFCNRTGIEDDAVYAGTSAVIGIHEGEVKVYGVLGRGVKELLVVDTDDPPFANLVMRNEKGNSSSSHQGLKPGEQRPSPVGSLERTPTKYHSDEPEQEQKAEPDAPKNKSSSSSSPPSALKGPASESHSFPTPTAPSPTPLSARPNLFGTSSCSAEDEAGPKKHRILGGSVTISFEEDNEISERDAEACHSALPTISSGPSPDHPSPRVPPSSGTVNETTISFKNPRDGIVDVPSYEDTIGHPQFETRERRSQSRTLSNSENAAPRRPKTATGIISTKQKSSAPRETSRRGRSRDRQYDTEQGRISEAEPFGSLRPRSQSATAQRHGLNDSSILKRPLSPKSRNASRSGRQIDVDQGFSQRALESCLRSIASKAGDGNLEEHPARTHSSVPVRNENDVPVRPSSGPGQLSSRTTPSRSNIGAPSTYIEPEQSRTLLWKAISKIVGEQLRRNWAQEEIRGRRRSRSAGTIEARRASSDSSPPRGSALSPARRGNGIARDSSIHPSRAHISTHDKSNLGSHTTPIERTTQTRQATAGMIRSVRDPSLGPPSDPEDEIVAEIVFRRLCCRNCGSRLYPDEERSSASANAHGSTAADKTRRNGEDNDAGPDRLKRQPPSDDEVDTTPTNSRLAEASQALGLLALQTSADELSELRAPNLSRASIRTLSSYDPSPITPPPRGLEPKVLRAMAFGLDQESMRLGACDPPSRFGFELGVDTSLDDGSTTKVEGERAHNLMQ